MPRLAYPCGWGPCRPASSSPPQARPQESPDGKDWTYFPKRLRGLPAAWPPLAAKTKRGHTTSWYDLLIFYGRSDWIRTSDPLLPKQVRYHAAPRSVMGCFVRKRPCFGKGGPSGGRKGRCLHEGGTASCRGRPLGLLSHRAAVGHGQERPSSPQKGAGHACPSLRTGKEQGSSVPRLPATAIGVSAGPFSRPATWRQKKKNPARKRGDFLMGRKMGLEPTATWATTRCSTN